MPWNIHPVSELRLALVHAVRSANITVTEAAKQFGVSRKTAYKWLARHDVDPTSSFNDRSRKPIHSPTQTSAELESVVLEVRDRFGWGPRKIHAYLSNNNQPTPPKRTVAAILKRHHRIKIKEQEHVANPQSFERAKPNELWQLDFKGPLEVERKRISPLTVVDDHSRYLLIIRTCFDQTYDTVQTALWNLFGDVGLPNAILCDNAFSARNTKVALSQFDAWLIRLGIRPVHGRPYHPQTQGKVERFHGTLERELWPKARRDKLAHFEADLNSWRPIYNQMRPHESVGDKPPVTRWIPSDRPRPSCLPEIIYPSGSELRSVSKTGDIYYHQARVLIGYGLAGERVRIVDNGETVDVYYGEYRVRSVTPAQLTPRAWV